MKTYDAEVQLLIACGGHLAIYILEAIQERDSISCAEIMKDTAYSQEYVSFNLDKLQENNVIVFEEKNQKYAFNPAMSEFARQLINALFPIAESKEDKQ